jgi:ATP-dependent DNA helicase RecG
MNLENLYKILHEGEGLTVEFKTAQHAIPKNIFETVCAFLNRIGGTILLGVADNGEIKGIDAKYVQKIKKELTNTLNNPQLINPPIYLQPNEIEIEDKTILLLQVYESSQVHNTRGLIFDRNYEGDFNITLNTNLVANLYIRKQSTFTENKIYPFATINELRTDIIQRVRQMALNRQPGHLWESMTDMELLRSVQLYQTDYSTGKEGLTLASILLFGRDEVIASVLPFHKTDAICRIQNLERYDDRDDIRTNLIESYDRLMRFVEKHLPEKFVLKGDIRISVRNLIFREVLANTLIHREYTNPYPAKLVIGVNKIYTENANKSHGELQLQPDNFSPFPKNPVIARVFKEIGRADELGSGIRNIYANYSYYSQQEPILEEKDIFGCTIFIDNIADENTVKPVKSDVAKDLGIENQRVGNDGINDGINDEINDGIKNKKSLIQIVEILKILPEITIPELSRKTGMSMKTVERNLSKLKELKLIQRVGSRKSGSWQVKGSKTKSEE